MIDSIKITSLTNIGANLSYTSIVPVVDVTANVTYKANLQIIGNLILSGAGGLNFVQAAQANLAQAVVNSAQPNITSVGTLISLAVTGNISGANIVNANTFRGAVVAFSALPAATPAGQRAFINNANLVAADNFGEIVGGGGSNTVPIWSDGTNWRIG